jgi:BMFP domain-containing protein YqiC
MSDDINLPRSPWRNDQEHQVGFISDMVHRISKVIATTAKTSDIEKIAVQLAELRLEQTNKQIEVDQLESALKDAQLAAFDGGDEEAVELVRDVLLVARDQADDLASLIAGLDERLSVAKRNQAAAARAKAESQALEHLSEMEAEIQKMTAGAEMIAAAVRGFNASRSRFFDVTPVRPEHTPTVWSSSLERLLMRHIGARCSMFRASIVGCENLDALAKANEMLVAHRDVMRQLFPDGPSSGAAKAA